MANIKHVVIERRRPWTVPGLRAPRPLSPAFERRLKELRRTVEEEA